MTVTDASKVDLTADGAPRATPTSQNPPLGEWIFSADDHLLESAANFADRFPRELRDRAPRIVDHNGGDAWLIEDEPVPISIGDGVASWPVADRPLLSKRAASGYLRSPGHGRPEPLTGRKMTTAERLDRNLVRVEEDFRPSVYDPAARVADMERDGVWGSVLIPSITFGFAGQRFSLYKDAEVGLACVRAYNDWLHEEVAGAHPGRLVCSQVPWLRDPELAAREVRRNAERGFTAMLFPENPERFGFPSIHSGQWDPIFAACEETNTVLNVHLGTGLKAIAVSSDSPLPVARATLAVNPALSAFDWIFSGIPLRFPNIKVAMTEGGIDWVPLVYGRIETFGPDRVEDNWYGDVSPAEVLLRNFWFAALFDVGAYAFLEEHCPDHVMLETDFPHGDSFWPESQQHFGGRLATLAPDFRRRIASENAAALYRQPAPPTSAP
jgi:predicted TIM-barrel fold metal-dependent hydrolase